MGKNKNEGAVKQGWFDRFLSALERACNKLPPPAILFIYLFVIVAVLGCIFSLLGVKTTFETQKKGVPQMVTLKKNGRSVGKLE